MPINRPRIKFHTRQIVVQKCTNDPIVGFEKTEELPSGWQYDIKRWCGPFDLKLPTLPRLADATLQGIKESEYYLSGVGDKKNGDLEIISIEEKNENNARKWIPFVKSGYYYRYSTPFYFFGDDSRVQYISSEDNIDNRNSLLLDVEPNQTTPIIAASYIRDADTGEITYFEKINMVSSFSGTYTDGEENETISLVGKINWDNVDFNKKEFILDTTNIGKYYLRFNKDYIKTYGIEPVVFQDLAACEILGLSNGTSYQVYYLKHFPVIPDSFNLYVASGSTWETWTRVNSWFDLLNSTGLYGQKRYYLDKDLGIVYFASGQENSLPPLGSYIACSYSTTLRVEYEEENNDLMSTAWDANISPVSQYINQGFICITHQLLEPASIVLKIDKQPIPFTIPKTYGPVSVGSDYAILKATVTTYDGIPVPNTSVVFFMDPTTVGYLNGASSSTSVTNGSGEAYTSYQPPTSADDLGYYITNQTGFDPKIRPSTNPSYTSHKDIIISDKNADIIGQENNIYIYEILKDDLLLGYENVDQYIDDNLTPPPWVIDETTRERWRREVIEEFDLKDWLEANGPSGVQTDGTISGRKVVIYTTDSAISGTQIGSTPNYDANAINPIRSGVVDSPPSYGAVVPVRPLLIERIDDDTDPYDGCIRLIYPEDMIPDPEPATSGYLSDGNNIAGYWIVSTKTIKFQAYCWSPRYNRDIYSNKIYTRISLPQYLLGEYINEQLEKIPYGWKLISETDNVAAGLNGATFLTINPISGPYKVLDLVHGTTTSEWASAPFNTLSFLVNVTS
jgi:hypothetical protein